ncbi:Piwi domain-containing protein [Haloarchaeobius baliensis]|uniref:Piwi domain-containing protein n=1 Tax=Haloarchaeobius baliensis TaxID=1670458 RepID=UPI003F883D1B
MPTQADIEDGKRIDITVQVVAELDRPTSKMAKRLKVRDTAGNEFPLAIWNNNTLSDFAWESGRWYELEHAKGNEFRGEKSLNGSSRLRAEVVGSPLDDTDNSSASEKRSGDQLFDTLQDNLPYLSLFPFDRHFETLSVYEYRIEADDAFEDSPMDATYNLAAYLRSSSNAAVTHAGVMSLISTEPLEAYLPDPFTLTGETRVTLRADDTADNETMVRLLQQLMKKSIRTDEYETGRVDRIRTKEPVISGPEGLFEACLAYRLSIEVLPSGDAYVGVEASHHARSQATVDEYMNRVSATVDELVDTHVEHDPETYSTPGSGRLKGVSDKRFTDPIPDFGNQSLADWYERKDRVSDEMLEQLRSENPRLVEVQYNPNSDETSVHVPQLLRVSPRKEVVKQLAPRFHREWDRRAKMLPEERFQKATQFITGLDELPAVETSIDPTPVGPSISFMSTEVDRADNLRFGNDRTADLPGSGLSRYGVYRRPSSFKLHYLVPERYADDFVEFRGRIEKQLEDINCSPDETSYSEYVLGREIEYSNAAAAISDVDAVLAAVPSPTNDFIQDGTIDDPYGEFKKALGKQTIPSQMVRVDNLDNKWVVRNTALGIVAGAGGVPWRVDQMPGDADCFVGLDATRDPDTGQFLGASANVVLADGTVFVSKTQSLQSGETFDEDAVVDVLKDVHREFVRAEGEAPNSIVVHRDGRLFEDVDAILAPFDGTGIDIDILDIRKSGAPRAAFRRNEQFRVDHKGRIFIAQNDDYGFLTTTGRPEFDDSDGLGTPRTLRIVRRAGETPMQTLMEQVYWLSESHVGSAQRSTRLPITTYYADRCAEAARKGYLVNGEIIRGVPYI